MADKGFNNKADFLTKEKLVQCSWIRNIKISKYRYYKYDFRIKNKIHDLFNFECNGTKIPDKFTRHPMTINMLSTKSFNTRGIGSCKI
jgi:hypothetical protein